MSDERPSKSARKREALAIRAIADELVALKPAQARRVVSDEDVLSAVLEAQSMNSHGALRRQKQYIARRLRDIDIATVRDGLDQIHGDSNHHKFLFKRAESLRDTLLSGSHGDHVAALGAAGLALTDVMSDEISRYHGTINVKLRKAASRSLFRIIHDQLTVARTVADKPGED
ncbi:MAG: ribosome biogenesis factor YjgA [Pseudomonadota bacterium]